MADEQKKKNIIFDSSKMGMVIGQAFNILTDNKPVYVDMMLNRDGDDKVDYTKLRLEFLTELEMLCIKIIKAQEHVKRKASESKTKLGSWEGIEVV